MFSHICLYIYVFTPENQHITLQNLNLEDVFLFFEWSLFRTNSFIFFLGGGVKKKATGHEEVFQVTLKQMLVTAEQKFPYLMWCHQTKKLTMSNDPPLEGMDLESILQHLVVLSSQGENILRFHALKKPPTVQDPKEGTSYPWLLTITTQMFQVLQRLCYHSIWLLVAVDLKKQSLGRSPLAKQIDSLIHPKH